MKFTSPDNQPWRHDRAKRAIKMAVKIAGITQEQAEIFVREVTDRSGNLEVVWSVTPSKRQMEAVADAWEIYGEDPSAVSHALGSSAWGR